jgi:hypothetical protein
MKEPCVSCDEKDKDFGGCRCQAYLLTGDMYATDPVCSKRKKLKALDSFQISGSIISPVIRPLCGRL